jgi:DNA-binding transcriptional regulator PaaX
MTTEHQTTREEEAYRRLLKEKKDMLSEAARTIHSEAQSVAYALCMVHNYSFQFEEYEEAIEEMRLAAAKITDSEHQLLAKIWRGALAAAASVDADDYETLAGYKVHSGDLHHYYRMVSSMIEETLQAKKDDEVRREIADQEPVDDSELPF